MRASECALTDTFEHPSSGRKPRPGEASGVRRRGLGREATSNGLPCGRRLQPHTGRTESSGTARMRRLTLTPSPQTTMSPDTWLAFVAAGWLICLSPGPGVLSCVTAGLGHGFRAALWNIAGLQAGATVTLIVVGVGLGALLAASPLAFAAVKAVGAGYLVWLGVQQWRADASPIRPPAEDASALRATGGLRRALFLRGLIVNATNPKGILFTASVLPQFIDPAAAQLPQYALVWVTLSVIDVCCMTGYTALGVQALRWLASPGVARAVNRGFGGLFVVAGLALALFQPGG